MKTRNRRLERTTHLLPRLLAVSALTFASVVTSASTFNASQVPGLTGTVVVTNKTPSTARIIDVATGRAWAVLPTGPGPHEVVLTSDGRTAVVTDASRNVVIVDVTEGVIQRVIPTGFPGSHMIGVTADGLRGYTGNISGNSVSELDVRAGVFVRSFDVPAAPEAINVTPDGKEVWVGSNTTGRVSVIDIATGTVSSAAEGMSWPYRVLFTPDLKTVVIPDARTHEIRFIERATRREISRLSFPGAGPQGVTVTPDGRYLFVSLSQQARIAIIETSTRTVVGHLPAGQTPDGMAYTTQVLTGAPR